MNTSIPSIDTTAGLCLTPKNWQSAGVNRVSCRLESLLVKPGLDFLMQLPDLATYLGGFASIVLNATGLLADKNGRYNIRSPYDGSVLSFSQEKLYALLQKLNPAILLLPQDAYFIAQRWDANTQVFAVATCLPPNVGQCLQYNPLQKVSQMHNCYVLGLLDKELSSNCFMQGAAFVGSDFLMNDAILGILHTSVGKINITEEQYRLDFLPIDTRCKCDTCHAGLTRAYLHHLYTQTPLLCQRLLLQHNAFYMTN